MEDGPEGTVHTHSGVLVELTTVHGSTSGGYMKLAVLQGRNHIIHDTTRSVHIRQFIEDR
jgi:hypothetical protein